MDDRPDRGRELLAIGVPCAIVAAFATCGCLNPYETRLPTVGLPPNVVEERSLQRFDPFADPEIGPATEARPREFRENVNDLRRLPAPVGFGGVPFAPPPATPFPAGAYVPPGVSHSPVTVR